MTSCPKCGAAMASGYLGTKTFPTGLQWYDEVNRLGFRVGEPVATVHKLQMEFLAGERCDSCHLMLLAY